MQDFKTKLYHYEAPLPEGMWDHIIDELNNEKVIKMHGYRKNKILFYSITAAASLIIIFLGSLFFTKNKTSNTSSTSIVAKENNLSDQKLKDSVVLNQQMLESIIHSPNKKQEIISGDSDQNNFSKKYLIIAGPEGQPVKISPKVATLIVSADNETPPKPVWSKEIRRWQQIMLSSTLSPTSVNFINFMQLASNKETVE
jgi:hypothetical protein